MQVVEADDQEDIAVEQMTEEEAELMLQRLEEDHRQTTNGNEREMNLGKERLKKKSFQPKSDDIKNKGITYVNGLSKGSNNIEDNRHQKISFTFLKQVPIVDHRNRVTYQKN